MEHIIHNKDNNENNDINENNDKYSKYVKMSNQEKYEFCIKEYNFIHIDNKKLFKKDLHMRYILKDETHNFFYDYEQDKFFLNSNEEDTVNKINSLNDMIIYIRVHNMDDGSINWIHPLYSNNIQYLEEQSNEWISLSIFNK